MHAFILSAFDHPGVRSRARKKNRGNKKSYQPVSRILFPHSDVRAAIIYLAPVLLQGSSCLPSGVASPSETSDEPPSTAGIRGISACKVYPRRQLPDDTVGSYPTFSSSPPQMRRICMRRK